MCAAKALWSGSLIRAWMEIIPQLQNNIADITQATITTGSTRGMAQHHPMMKADMAHIPRARFSARMELALRPKRNGSAV